VTLIRRQHRAASAPRLTGS